MFKRMFVVLVVCLLVIPFSTAYADVVVEPENNFYKQHRSELVLLGRHFVVAGEGESVSVKEEPDAPSDKGQLQSGEVVYLNESILYNGSYWGFIEEYEGWVMIDELEVIYDYITFSEEHEGEFYQYEGELPKLAMTRAALAWTWPGSGEYKYLIEDLDPESFSVYHAYTDAEGQEWGFIGNYHGYDNFWICIDDPMNRDIPAFNPASKPAGWVSNTPHKDVEAAFDNSTIILVVALVVVVALATIVLIAVLWRPKKELSASEKGQLP